MGRPWALHGLPMRQTTDGLPSVLAVLVVPWTLLGSCLDYNQPLSVVSVYVDHLSAVFTTSRHLLRH